MQHRRLAQLWPARQVSDGAGVKIQRSLGLTPQLRLDPFLMLDCFGSDQSADYIAGFPAHPHRGFETVTYMLDGHMLHEDHLGNRGHLVSGGVQWMTAGRGIIHSEMPQQEAGLMRGFQLWLNLPASEKMQAPAYLDLAPAQIPTVALPAPTATTPAMPAGQIKVIAGTLHAHGLPRVSGPVQTGSTDPLYLDLQLQSAGQLTFVLPLGYNALLYPYEGSLHLISDPAGHNNHQQHIGSHQAAVLTDGDLITIETSVPARAILLAARPIGEPVVQYGPFVMNSVAEIEQAIADYQQGRLTEQAAARLTPSN